MLSIVSRGLRRDLAGGPPALSGCSLMGQQCRCKDIWCSCAQPCAWNVVFKPGKQHGNNLPSFCTLDMEISTPKASCLHQYLISLCRSLCNLHVSQRVPIKPASAPSESPACFACCPDFHLLLVAGCLLTTCTPTELLPDCPAAVD